MLENLGVSYAFGVSGVAMASLWDALSNSSIEVLNFRHEAGAAFAATEAYFAIAKSVELLSAGPFAIWVGFGARDAADEILQLAEKMG